MNRLTLLLAVVVAGLAAFCAVQWRKLSDLKPRAARLNSEVEEKTRRLAELESAQQSADQQKRQLLKLTDELGAQIRAQYLAAKAMAATNATAVPAPTNGEAAKADNGGLGSMLSKMMSDPDTKKFIRNQQRMMVDQLYQPLVKQLGLTTEEATAFKDLLADNMMRGAEKATALLGNMSGTNRAQLASAVAAEQKTADEQMRAFLGEERYSIYKDYQETVGERTQLNTFRQQSAAGESPLNDMQVEQLLALMREEKRSATGSMGQGLAGGDQAGMEAMLSAEGGERLLQAQEAANQRILERARNVLSPDQLQAFASFQTNQIQMMRMGMSMARRLMGPGETGSGQPGQ